MKCTICGQKVDSRKVVRITVEHYVIRRKMVRIIHDACPECSERIIKAIPHPTLSVQNHDSQIMQIKETNNDTKD
jgi:hypothetical protein